MFLYKREKDDSEPRHIIDLQKAKISQGKRSTGEAIFNIYTSELEIKIQLNSNAEYDEWG